MPENQPTTDLLAEADFIPDAVDRGVAELREQQAVSRVPREEGAFSTPSLEDVDGIGPSTADKLRDAGVNKPEELTRLTPSQIERVDGIGPSRADKLADTFQYSQQARFQKSTSDPSDVREKHAERSKKARIADRSFNAEITLDEDEWLSDPDKYDFPGVDTVPEQRRAERASAAADRVGVNVVDAGELSGQTMGRQSGGRVSVDPGAADPVSTLAHEVGHAIEPSRGFAEENIFEDSEELRDQAGELSARRRFTTSEMSGGEIRDYIGGGAQDEDAELFADAVGVAIEEPRAARREAPELISKIEREFGDILPGRRS
jgi:predicted flap endonuclease-1-like 5' DNA nuclease